MTFLSVYFVVGISAFVSYVLCGYFLTKDRFKEIVLWSFLVSITWPISLPLALLSEFAEWFDSSRGVK